MVTFDYIHVHYLKFLDTHVKKKSVQITYKYSAAIFNLKIEFVNLNLFSLP